MGRKKKAVSPRVEKAARLLNSNQNLITQEAMLEAEDGLNTITQPGFLEKKRKQILKKQSARSGAHAPILGRKASADSERVSWLAN